MHHRSSRFIVFLFAASLSNLFAMETVIETWQFAQQFKKNPKTTGSFIPSWSWLADEITRHIQTGDRVLEVGAGSGVFTKKIVHKLGANGHVDAVELNNEFCDKLKRKFSSDSRVNIVQSNILNVELQPSQQPYDIIVCGLPFKNFSAKDVRAIVTQLRKLVKVKGTISYFGYDSLAPLYRLHPSKTRRTQFKQIEKELNRLKDNSTSEVKIVFINFPPAHVHHVTIDYK